MRYISIALLLLQVFPLFSMDEKLSKVKSKESTNDKPKWEQIILENFTLSYPCGPDIISMTECQVALGGNFVCFIGSMISEPISGSSLTHNWIEIELETKTYICAQFGSKPNPEIELKWFSTQEEVEKYGIMTGGGNENSALVRQKPRYFDPRVIPVDVKYIYEFVKKYQKKHGQYHVLYNNCQTFSKALLKKCEQFEKENY